MPSDILDGAYISHGELAWARADALQVANLLGAYEHRILGIDTWFPTRPGPTPLIEDWDDRDALPAIEFIRTFQTERIRTRSSRSGNVLRYHRETRHMTNTAAEDWHSLVPPDILNRAYGSSSGELAWSEPDALQVVKILQARNHRILGMEIWLPTQPGPTIPMPFFYHWDEHFSVSATEYIETFEWDEADLDHLGMVPYFNITA